MTSSEFDQFRPPRPPRKGGKGKGRKGSGDAGRRRRGRGDEVMVPDVTLEHIDERGYYGHPVLKAPPWETPVPTYLVLGGIAGGSGLLAAGAQLTGHDVLRRNTRLTGLTAAGAGSIALMIDLGRPERFLHMLRTFKITSPMSVGSWILVGFSGLIGVTAVSEVDRLTGNRLPLGTLRQVLRGVEGPAGLAAAVFGAPLAAYTAVLLGDTAMPTWNAMHHELPYVFASSASLAASGVALVLTPAEQAGPARNLAVLGVIGDLVATRVMESRMDPVLAEPLHHGTPGRLMRAAEALAAIGGIGALVSGGRRGRAKRVLAAASGAALVAASTCTRFGIFHAGIDSANDPRYVIEPQKRRLAERRAAGITDDSITGL